VKTEIEITNEVIFEYNKLKSSSFQLKSINKKGNDCIVYKYDIGVFKNNEMIALIEAKKRFETSRPTTDAMIASLFKLSYEWVHTFNKKPQTIFLFYIKDDSLKVKQEFRNNLFNKFNQLIFYEEKLNIKIINLNIQGFNFTKLAEKLEEFLIKEITKI